VLLLKSAWGENKPQGLKKALEIFLWERHLAAINCAMIMDKSRLEAIPTSHEQHFF
jgi:hypothetical protein